MLFASHQGKLTFVMKKDSKRGSVKSTISSSDACQLSPFEVKRIKLSKCSVETVCTSLLPFPTWRLWSRPSGNKLRGGNLFDGACLRFAAPSSSFTCSAREKNQDICKCNYQTNKIYMKQNFWKIRNMSKL